ncbi:hypothetical protein [Chondromyces apiculatus]|uniref:Molecular chaperone DnaJ n=1 Tax=Chondromyces apiculatus DSM 436 TaxID=1192034 RepID=A0A017T149_9BACT|nr:hypothetical protein [Chondromyces apiculatus]EYF02953.1 Hypothetical protein CAP_6376 [Chondromyces apiculatus DSM 436]
MGRGDEALGRIRDNPFYVLGLRPAATRMEVEREGQKLLGMLELKLKSAGTYATPVGPGERTPDKVRRAMAELRDPEKRLGHELWARLTPDSGEEPERSGTRRVTALEAAELAEEAELEAMAAEAAAEARAREGENPLAPWPEALQALGWAAGRSAR